MDGQVYAESPDFFRTKANAVKKAKEELADDFGISLDDIEYKAQQRDGDPYAISISRDGRFEAYSVFHVA